MQVNGAVLTYHEEGAGDPVVFLPGIMADYL